jgi:hypothetical protein
MYESQHATPVNVLKKTMQKQQLFVRSLQQEDIVHVGACFPGEGSKPVEMRFTVRLDEKKSSNLAWLNSVLRQCGYTPC